MQVGKMTIPTLQQFADGFAKDVDWSPVDLDAHVPYNVQQGIQNSPHWEAGSQKAGSQKAGSQKAGMCQKANMMY